MDDDDESGLTANPTCTANSFSIRVSAPVSTAAGVPPLLLSKLRFTNLQEILDRLSDLSGIGMTLKMCRVPQASDIL